MDVKDINLPSLTEKNNFINSTISYVPLEPFDKKLTFFNLFSKGFFFFRVGMEDDSVESTVNAKLDSFHSLAGAIDTPEQRARQE